MSLYPLYNSLRIALFSSIIIFFLGLFLGYWVKKFPKVIKGIFDVILTLPLVLPPTVCGFFLLIIFGPNRPVGKLLLDIGIKIAMDWKGGVIASAIVSFPLMYRTVRGAFEAFDENLAFAGKTLGLSNHYIFWRIRVPACKNGIAAGSVLAFARALGEYGATSMLIGYIPGRTATISTTIYQYWRTNDDKNAWLWVGINLIISALVLIFVNIIVNTERGKKNEFSSKY